MKKTIYIFGLAIALLFSAGCGKKEDNLDDQLFSKSKDIVAVSTEKTTKNLPAAKTETIDVKIHRGVILHGNAICSDGKIITNFTFRATPRGLHESQGNPGHINEIIMTNEKGDFEIAGLLPEHYKFKISTDKVDPITTNLILYSDEENYLELVFPKRPFIDVNGIVSYEQSGEPASGIEIEYAPRGYEKIKAVTDENGKFNISLPIIKHHSFSLKIDEPGYARIQYRIYKYSGETVRLLLRETGILTGYVENESGKPVFGVRIKICPEHSKTIISKMSFSNQDAQWRNAFAYEAESKYPSDESGMYVISNAAAPQAYRIKLRDYNRNFQICNKNRKIKIEPGETTVYNIKLRKTDKPGVLIKVKDKDGDPIPNYSLDIKSTDENGAVSSGSHNVHLSQSDDWYRVNIFIKDGNGKLDLTARTDDRRIGKKKNILIETGKDNKITLILSEPLEPIIAGFVYNPDLTPYIDGSISASFGKLNNRGKTDHFGYFEIIELDVEKGTKIELSTWINYVWFYTNTLAGDDNLEWILPKPKRITGRVCIGNNYTPATNFAISILRTRDKKGFISKNGDFSFPISNFRIQTNSKIQVYAFVQGYAPTIKEITYTLDKSNVCNIGDIVVMNKPATIRGRVVNHEYDPLRASVSLINKRNKKQKGILQCQTDDNDGIFELADIPPDTYYIKARTRHNSVKSDFFDLHSGETYELSDLIIFETNTFPVTFKFVFQDGTPAANGLVGYFDRRTDDRGILTEKIYPLNFGKWSVIIGHKWYDSEEVIIKKETRELTVKITYLPVITGTVTLDGKPLKNSFLRFDNGNDVYHCRAYYGEFKVKALPGKYTVTCQGKNIKTVIELSESGPNKIIFKNELNLTE